MINNIRSVRRAKRMTLEDVAAACVPPTTAQTIGRLETGTRTLSLGWMTRIAAALGVEPRDLVTMPEEEQLSLAAIIDASGSHAPTQMETLPPLRPEAGMVAVRIDAATGDYRAGDILWCRRIERTAVTSGLNRDVLVPRPAGRFLFGRLLAVDGDKLHLLPLTAGSRQQVIAIPEWIGIAARLVRTLAP